jgi:acetate kinase
VTRTVLVINCGSSSLKYELVDPDAGAHGASGSVQRIGEDQAQLVHSGDGERVERCQPVADHEQALRTVLGLFDEVGPNLTDAGVAAVGHRVVMGGQQFAQAALIDEEVVAAIERLSPLAPLHNPANLAGIRVATELLGTIPHVAVFDTAFFRDLPAAARTYALDQRIADTHAIRRYGFHGTSHQYVSTVAAQLVGGLTGRDPAALRQIVLHLGNGASATAIAGGRPVDTSMGLTPLEGLVMGTRTGDIDPAVVFHLSRNAGMTIDEIDDLMNRSSGLKGLAGHNDMREVRRRASDGDPDAGLALEVYRHRLRSYIGAYAAVLGGLDVVSFTAGIGENDAALRAETVQGLEFLGLSVDPDRNATRSDDARIISPEGSPVTVLVVPTDEELAIARQTVTVLNGQVPVLPSADPDHRLN